MEDIDKGVSEIKEPKQPKNTGEIRTEIEVEPRTVVDSVISYESAIQDRTLSPAERFKLRITLKKGASYKKSALKKILNKE